MGAAIALDIAPPRTQEFTMMKSLTTPRSMLITFTFAAAMVALTGCDRPSTAPKAPGTGATAPMPAASAASQ
jgi:hypothetical protein